MKNISKGILHSLGVLGLVVGAMAFAPEAQAQNCMILSPVADAADRRPAVGTLVTGGYATGTYEDDLGFNFGGGDGTYFGTRGFGTPTTPFMSIHDVLIMCPITNMKAAGYSAALTTSTFMGFVSLNALTKTVTAVPPPLATHQSYSVSW